MNEKVKMSSAAEILSGRAKFMDSFSTRSPQDVSTCTIDGVVCLQDDRIVCLDNSNLRIKVFSPECRFIFSKEVESPCTDLTVVSDIDVATLQDFAIVTFVIGEREISKRRKTIKIKGRPLAVSSAGDMFAVLSEQKSKHIEIFERSGDVIHNHSMEQLGKDIVGCVHFIKMHQSGTKFYILDTSGRIYCFDTLGTCLWSISIPGNPSAGTIFDKVLVLVCSNNHSIFALDDSGVEQKVLIEDERRIVQSGSMTLQRRSRSILLSMDENINKFVIYRF